MGFACHPSASALFYPSTPGRYSDLRPPGTIRWRSRFVPRGFSPPRQFAPGRELWACFIPQPALGSALFPATENLYHRNDPTPHVAFPRDADTLRSLPLVGSHTASPRSRAFLSLPRHSCVPALTVDEPTRRNRRIDLHSFTPPSETSNDSDPAAKAAASHSPNAQFQWFHQSLKSTHGKPSISPIGVRHKVTSTVEIRFRRCDSEAVPASRFNLRRAHSTPFETDNVERSPDDLPRDRCARNPPKGLSSSSAPLGRESEVKTT